jgi:hypothetical protein
MLDDPRSQSFDRLFQCLLGQTAGILGEFLGMACPQPAACSAQRAAKARSGRGRYNTNVLTR